MLGTQRLRARGEGFSSGAGAHRRDAPARMSPLLPSICASSNLNTRLPTGAAPQAGRPDTRNARVVRRTICGPTRCLARSLGRASELSRLDRALVVHLLFAANVLTRRVPPVPQDPFVDIHCHLLPGIDDGAGDWRDTLAMARMAAADGIGTIVTTPHQLGNFAQNTGDDIRHLTAQVQNVLREQKIPVTLLPGADVRIEPEMIAMIRRGEVLTLADRGRHVLLELPHELYLPLDRLLDELRAAGLVGILSHPERNQGILARPAVLEPLVRAGCLMQVTAGSLAGSFGPDIKRFSEWMVGEGLVHFLATDAHGPKSRRPLMSRAYRRAMELAGEHLATEMCSTNPAHVAAGEDVRGGIRQPRAPRRGLASWFGWRKAG